MNRKALERMGWVLRKMHAEARKRDAPVLRAERSSASSPFQILVFTMLSARTKDETTIKVAARLFRDAKTPEQVLALGPRRLEKLLYGAGFYRVKARHLAAACRMLCSGGGRVPDTLEGLLGLPGVGRKTANIVLARAFGKNALGVDVHVHRISNRLGIVRTRKPEDTERTLVRIIRPRHITTLNRDFVAFGQTVCLPVRPLCSKCPIRSACKRVGVRSSR